MDADIKKEFQNIKNRVLYPILVVIIIGIGSIILTYFKDVKANKEAISKKVDQERFNEYLSLQSRINTLTEERQKILTDRVNNIENEIKRIDEINTEIARLQEKIKYLLSDYSLKTRGNEQIIYPIDFFIKET